MANPFIAVMILIMRHHKLLLIVPALLVAACDSTGPRIPEVRHDSSAVAAGAHNVLSAVVRVYGMGDSARIRFGVTASGALDSLTPAVLLENDSARVPVLGLLPATAYQFAVELFGGSDTVLSPTLALTTGALPGDLPSYTASGPAPLPGFVVFSAGQFGLVIDNTGRVVWYRRFVPNGPGLNFMAQPAGVYIGRPGSNFLVVDALGDSVRNISCALGRTVRFHDLIVEPGGSAWIMCDETRTVDLTAYGGAAAAQVTGTTVQHLGPSGELLFEWTPFDHFAWDDADTVNLIGNTVNWLHGNSLDLDTDGHVLLSTRTLSEVTKINSQTGAVIWRLGGRRNQFSFTGSPNPGFATQHNVRSLGANLIMILDNNGASESRYERYQLDPVGLTATLVQSYGSTPAVLTPIGGSVQRAGDNRWLVSFGTQGRVEEFDQTGATLWRIDGNPGYVFRAQRIQSLYAPGVGSDR